MLLCWHNTISTPFAIYNCTRQGSALLPYLFTQDILLCITNSNIGCNIGGCMVNILAYADDLVLLAPSWRALQLLLDKLHSIAGVTILQKCCNMVARFQILWLIMWPLNMSEFKYLGHVVSNSQLDDADIHRECKNLFYHCNMLMRWFSKCSVAMKLQCLKLFACVFEIGLSCKKSVIVHLEDLPNFSLLMWNVLKYFLDIVSFIMLPWCWTN